MYLSAPGSAPAFKSRVAYSPEPEEDYVESVDSGRYETEEEESELPDFEGEYISIMEPNENIRPVFRVHNLESVIGIHNSDPGSFYKPPVFTDVYTNEAMARLGYVAEDLVIREDLDMDLDDVTKSKVLNKMEVLRMNMVQKLIEERTRLIETESHPKGFGDSENNKKHKKRLKKKKPRKKKSKQSKLGHASEKEALDRDSYIERKQNLINTRIQLVQLQNKKKALEIQKKNVQKAKTVEKKRTKLELQQKIAAKRNLKKIELVDQRKQELEEKKRQEIIKRKQERERRLKELEMKNRKRELEKQKELNASLKREQARVAQLERERKQMKEKMMKARVKAIRAKASRVPNS